jgi:DNA repair photolyase
MQEDHSYKKGRGAQFNPSNRFLAQQYEPDEEEQIESRPDTQFFTESPKTILSKVDSPDLPMMYSINPYRGCEHGCIYCYARNSHEFWGFSAGLDFETKITVKPDAPALLEKEFRKKSWTPVPISFSGNTDCYQPAERRYRITRQLLALCLKYRNPLSIITKNALVLRDLDLISELARLRLVHVYISITTLNESLRLKMEPRTATTRNRLKVVETLNKSGVPVGVMAAPIIPGLNNQEIPAIIREAAGAGAGTVGYTIVRLNGAIGDIFQDWIRKNFPDRADKVLNQVAACHGGKLGDSRFGTRMSGEGAIAASIGQLFQASRKKFMPDAGLPPYDLTLFTRDGQLSLF